MSVRRSAPGATPTGSGEPTSVTSISGHGRGLRWQKSRKSYACSFGNTARLACTKPGASPAVTVVSRPARMSARISFGWRASIGISGLPSPVLPSPSLLEVPEPGPEIGIGEHVRLLPAQHAEHLGGHLERHPAHGLAGHPRDVGRDDHVLELEEAVVGGRGLLLEDVDARRADLAALEPGHERVLVLGLAAGGVDEDHAVLHL